MLSWNWHGFAACARCPFTVVVPFLQIRVAVIDHIDRDLDRSHFSCRLNSNSRCLPTGKMPEGETIPGLSSNVGRDGDGIPPGQTLSDATTATANVVAATAAAAANASPPAAANNANTAAAVAEAGQRHRQRRKQALPPVLQLLEGTAYSAAHSPWARSSRS